MLFIIIATVVAATQPTTKPTEIAPLINALQANQELDLPGEYNLTGRFAALPSGAILDGKQTGVLHLRPVPDSPAIFEPTGVKGFTVRNFKSIDGEGAIFLYDGGQNTTISGVTFAYGFLSVVKTNHLATSPDATFAPGGLTLSKITVTETSSVGVYITTDDAVIADSNLGPSLGECSLRYDAAPDAKGQPVFVNGWLRRPRRPTIRNCTITNNGNRYQKQAIEFREADNILMYGCKVYGGIRLGQSAITNPNYVNAACTISRNTFYAPYPGIPPVLIFSGAGGYFVGNTSDVSIQDANLPTVAIDAGSSFYLDCNIQQVPVGQTPKPLVGQSSAGQYVIEPTNTVIYIPGK